MTVSRCASSVADPQNEIARGMFCPIDSAQGNYMKPTLALAVALAVIGSSLVSRADEHLDTLKIGSDVYTNVTVTRVSATDVYFTFPGGMANAKLKSLDPELQRHFGYNVSAAKAAEKLQHPGPVEYHFRVANGTSRAPKKAADIKVEYDDAVARAKAIINQPVTQLRETHEMESQTGYYNEGWFHPGAIKPNFQTVDIRKTREANYAKFKYVTSNLNPGVVFLGSELEFNSMTKYFYVDRSLPKKKLSETEMLEINRLYRIIGEDEAALAK